jgi:PIN domain nuclease of toxin-antitoxin system
VRVLVDTHVALWGLTDDPRLSERARAVLDGTIEADRFLSLASAHEIAVKVSIGKLALDRPLAALFAAFASDLRLTPLPVTHLHCSTLAALPLHHRDPFDRMLVAQAQVEQLDLLTADGQLAPYGVPIVW